MPKKVLFVLGVLLAALTPVVISSTAGRWSDLTVSLAPGRSSNSSDQWDSSYQWGGGVARDRPHGVPSAPMRPPPPWPDDTAVRDLAEVLRFDVTPDWIVSQWPRVSAGLAHLSLQGYRVPLVTGTAQDDLAGALTYYFNPRQRLQRITFYGTTGNSRKLVALVTTRFGFARRLVNDASVFLYELPDSRGRARSFLWIRPTRVVRASEPHRRFKVAFVIERPEERQ